jgi:2-C-methyl-D-erythritol 4-phosphate cytidylyltransferase
MSISRQVPLPEPIRAFTVPAVPSTIRRDVGVVIVAGGKGTRTAGTELKQFRWLGSKPVLLHSVQTFLERNDVCAVVCVLPREYAADPPPWLMQNDLERLLISVGGEERTESVRNGLEDLAPEARIVLIHDAARPLVTHSTIDRVIAGARAGRGVTAALPVVDTLKEVDDRGNVMRTVERAKLWRAQTPQGFPREMIERAHRDAAAARVTATDDAGLVERLGIVVQVVRGSERAMKITDEADFVRAEKLIMLPDADAPAP